MSSFFSDTIESTISEINPLNSRSNPLSDLTILDELEEQIPSRGSKSLIVYSKPLFEGNKMEHERSLPAERISGRKKQDARRKLEEAKSRFLRCREFYKLEYQKKVSEGLRISYLSERAHRERLERELDQTREELDQAREELNQTREELKQERQARLNLESQFQSMNEILQSLQRRLN